MAAALSFDNFLTGLLSAVVLRGRRAVSIRGDRFDYLVERAVAVLQERVPEVDLHFHVERHFVHGYSLTVRDGIAAATQADIISLDNPEYQDIRFKIDVDDAEILLGYLPISKAVFLEVADAFLADYDDTMNQDHFKTPAAVAAPLVLA